MCLIEQQDNSEEKPVKQNERKKVLNQYSFAAPKNPYGKENLMVLMKVGLLSAQKCFLFCF